MYRRRCVARQMEQEVEKPQHDERSSAPVSSQKF